MTLKQQIDHDFKEAMKNGDKDRKTFLSVLRADIQTAEKKKDFKGDETILATVKSWSKKLNEMREVGSDQGKEDAERELGYLEKYLPKQMSREEIENIVTQLIVNGANNIGAIMQAFNKEYRGKADNRIVKEIAESKL